MRMKRIAGIVLAMVLVLGTVTAQAVELTTPGGTVTTDVTLADGGSGQEPDIFSVVIPAELPIHMDKDGNVTVGGNLFIENHSTKAVQVTGIFVDGRNGWSIADYDDDFSVKAADTKELGLSFRGDVTEAGGHVAPTSGNWVIGQDENLDIMASAQLGRQSQTAESNIAVINWTLDWADTVS